jgi:hypothetical protein
MTLCITIKKIDIQNNGTRLSVAMLRVAITPIMIRIVMPSGVHPECSKKSLILNAIMLNVNKLSVVAPTVTNTLAYYLGPSLLER